MKLQSLGAFFYPLRTEIRTGLREKRICTDLICLDLNVSHQECCPLSREGAGCDPEVRVMVKWWYRSRFADRCNSSAIPPPYTSSVIPAQRARLEIVHCPFPVCLWTSTGYQRGGISHNFLASPIPQTETPPTHLDVRNESNNTGLASRYKSSSLRNTPRFLS